MLAFSLEKTLGLLLMPAGLFLLLLLAGAAVCLRRRRSGGAAFLLALAAGYGAAGNIHLAGALCRGLERRVPNPVVETLEPFDAVCVLGGGSDQDPAGRPELGPAGDRVMLGARLWYAGKTRLLVASGMAHDGVAGVHDGGQETRALWRAVGVPDRAILVVPEPCWNTRDEIGAYVRLQASHGWKRIGLVSSAIHLPRAMALAERAGLRCTPLGADWLGRRRPFQLQDLVPQAGAFSLTQRACWEYLGRWVGH